VGAARRDVVCQRGRGRRDVAWTLALAYDWLHARLDAEQKNQLLAALRVRVADMFDDVAGDGAGRLSVHPYDSHGNQTLLQLAAIFRAAGR